MENKMLSHDSQNTWNFDFDPFFNIPEVGERICQKEGQIMIFPSNFILFLKKCKNEKASRKNSSIVRNWMV